MGGGGNLIFGFVMLLGSGCMVFYGGQGWCVCGKCTWKPGFRGISTFLLLLLTLIFDALSDAEDGLALSFLVFEKNAFFFFFFFLNGFLPASPTVTAGLVAARLHPSIRSSVHPSRLGVHSLCNLKLKKYKSYSFQTLQSDYIHIEDVHLPFWWNLKTF